MGNDSPKWKFIPTIGAASADAIAEAMPLDDQPEFVESSNPITFYKEPERTEPPAAGVSPGYLVARAEWLETGARVAKCAMLHDGEGKFVVDVDTETWQDATIVDDTSGSDT